MQPVRATVENERFDSSKLVFHLYPTVARYWFTDIEQKENAAGSSESRERAG